MDCLCLYVEFRCNESEKRSVSKALEMTDVPFEIYQSGDGNSCSTGSNILVLGRYNQSGSDHYHADLLINFSPDSHFAGENVLTWPGSVSLLADQLANWFYRPPEQIPLMLNMVGRSSAFQQLQAMIERVARYRAPVFLHGETGTGKEVAARAVHYLSDEQNGPFIPVNCGAWNDDLFLAELFGYEKGAFTDAHQRRVGLISQAEGGTLFLDEVDSLSARSQVALLRFLQDYEYTPLGSSRSGKANIRIITASNSDISMLVKSGKFREDLFYRLDILGINIPSLRERYSDIPILCEYFLSRFSSEYHQPIKALSERTLCWMKEYRWPGNIRELENYLHKMFVLVQGDLIDVPDIKGLPDLKGAASEPAPLAVAQTSSLNLPGLPGFESCMEALDIVETQELTFNDARQQVVSRFEHSYLDQLLLRCRGNISQAARIAGKERRTFSRLLEKHGLERSNYCN